MSEENKDSGAKKKKPFYSRWWFLTLVALVVIGAIVGEDGTGTKSNDGKLSSSSSGGQPAKTESQRYLGERVETQYFAVTVNKVTESTGAIGGGDFCESPKSGSKFVVIDLTIENTDTESRTLMEAGELFVNYDGKKLNYDTDANCLYDESALGFMEDLGPLVKTSGRVVFEVPSQISLEGATYQPPRSSAKIQLSKRQ